MQFTFFLEKMPQGSQGNFSLSSGKAMLCNINMMGNSNLSTLIAQRLNIDAVQSITSMVISPSQRAISNDQTPP